MRALDRRLPTVVHMKWRRWRRPQFQAANGGTSLTPAPRHRDVLVLSGGGLAGAAQVGMLRALARSGWRPDAIVGTSAGALNGAWMAAGFHAPRVDTLEQIWLGLRQRGVFPDGTAAQAYRVLRRRSAVQGSDTLRQLIDRCCPVDDLRDFVVPLHVSATDLTTGEPVWLNEGPATTALLASASIPGVVPPVEHDGRILVDGGVVANVPVSRAVDVGATRIVCLDVSGDLSAEATPTTALGVLLHSYTACRVALSDRDLRVAAAGVDALWRIRPDFPNGLRSTHWHRIPELIEVGEAAGEAFLAMHREQLLAPSRPAANPSPTRPALDDILPSPGGLPGNLSIA